jgi:bifunctional enzyme CysN/CysC
MNDVTFPASSRLATSSEKSTLRLLTCGSVDDGKSTLIGRLLFDSMAIPDDQLLSLERDSKRFGTAGGEIDFALLLDGLEAERQQGITIDVAYRYFRTDRRTFLVADAPGHEQYTRNMVTGASTADLAIILVDARKGVLAQTKRHSRICALLGIRHIVLAVNKLDLLGYSADTFRKIEDDYRAFAEGLNFSSLASIPISALHGDNTVSRSPLMAWYEGPALLQYLEDIEVGSGEHDNPFRFPVQWVNRPSLDFRGLAGTVASGSIRVGEEVMTAVSRQRSTVARIVTSDGDCATAMSGDAVTLTLVDDIDVARGDILVRPEHPPETADQFAAYTVWMGEEPMLPGRSYLMRIGMRYVPASVTGLRHKLDVNTHEHLAGRELSSNEIGFCHISTVPIAFDPYADNRDTGSFILIDRTTNATIGAGMIAHPLRRAANLHAQPLLIDKTARAGLKAQRPTIVWFTGLSGAGKSTIANLVEQALHRRGIHTYLLDGDNVRHGLNRDLGFTDPDRVENIRRVGEVAKLFVDAGLIVLCSFISPFRAERDMVRSLVAEGEFVEVFVDTSLEVCIRRDPKGLYAKAKEGKIPHFTGLDSPYEAPQRPELTLATESSEAEASADEVVRWLRDRGYVL